jgi:glycosyltransferase involved in cell wall biosynthesis
VSVPGFGAFLPRPLGKVSGVIFARHLAELARKLNLEVLEAPEFGGLTALLNLFKPPELCVVVRLHTCTSICRSLDGRHPPSIGDRLRDARKDWMERRAIRTADSVTAISKANVDLTRRMLGVRRDDFLVTPNPVNDLFFLSAEDAPVPGAPLVLFVGRLQWLKGPDLLVKALPAIAGRHPDARFCLVGGDTNTGPGGTSMLAHLLSLVPEPARSRVDFAGALKPEEVVKRYRQATVCVFPSRWEGFGLVAAEAMACGKAVVVTDVGGFRGVVADGETGLVAKREGTESLASAIDRLLRDGALRARLGAAAREVARLRFHGTVVAGSMIGVYRAAIAQTWPAVSLTVSRLARPDQPLVRRR